MTNSIKSRRIYLASSWRNPHQPAVLAALRAAGHEVYDFRNPAPGQKGFAWRDCGGIAASDGPGTGAKTIPSYLEAIRSDRAAQGFEFDKSALEWCDTCVLALPCGRSAHLELGYAAGQGKDTYVLLHEDTFEPELMYLLNTGVSASIDEIIGWMAQRQPGSVSRWHEESGGYGGAPFGHAIRFLHEVVELCVATGASQEEIIDAVGKEIGKAAYRNEFGGDASAVREEYADCAIMLKVFAHHARIDEHGEIRKKLDVLWDRDWQADASGALYRPSLLRETV
jgi:NTP pyrophosphatase (non-canonical NTP hydrolase)/nucleoside 2-deoxyribosyltransferase